MPGYLAKMKEQKFEELNFFYDQSTDLKVAIAIHSTARGPALGGTRMWSYSTEEEAIDDVMWLARGMSYKNAVAELPLGGGKGLIIGDPAKDKCEELFYSYGRLVERLSGRFITAADMGTNEKDLDCICQETKHIVGGSETGSPSPFTAYGVWHGIKACAEEVFGSPNLSGKTVAIQGIGSVGSALCQYLADEGVNLIVSDLDQEKVKEAINMWNATAVPIDAIHAQKCDIFSPCGAGGAINSEIIDQLQCSIIAGAANNIIKEKELGAVLKDNNILYAPDYVINAGGIIFCEMSRQGVRNSEEIRSVVSRIYGRLKEIFRRAREEGLSPEQIADIVAEEKLQEKA